MKIPQPMPYQGSKRSIANSIYQYFPSSFNTLYEPFAGSAAISIYAATKRKDISFYLNDINKPLMELLNKIINEPKAISEEYESIWNGQVHSNDDAYYDKIRDRFNSEKNPACLLYLLSRCVKASVRYNSKGEFNQSKDKRRLGKRPALMRKEIFRVSSLLKGRTQISDVNYRDVFELATPTDLVYLDPPYQGVCGNRDSRYYEKIKFNEFVEALNVLCERNIPFILSYDGRRESKKYGEELPQHLNLKKIEIHAGRSTQSTLLGRNETTYETIYLSEALLEKLPKRAIESKVLKLSAVMPV